MTIILSWDQNPKCSLWSDQLLTSIQQHWSSLEMGQPNNFLPGYQALYPDNKLRFWAELVIKMIEFESYYNPQAVYQEGPPLNDLSVGLLQLSYSDQKFYPLESLSETEKSLEDPLINIRCAITILAYWTEKDKVVAKGDADTSRGGARYWSVLREGHHINEIRDHAREVVGL